MARQIVRRKPISFDTTLRNPRRIPQFISVLQLFEGQVLDDETALKLEAEIIKQKIFNPTAATLGNYRKTFSKLNFIADDQSPNADKRVNKYFQEWKKSEAGEYNVDNIIYLLKNTVTDHKEAGWNGGWESRIHTQFNFLNELGFVQVIKNKVVKISENGKLMITEYTNGYPKEDYSEIYEESAFLNAFAKYQINNPYRRNTINVNFFPLVLNVIKYLDEKYDRNGISIRDIPFIITWGNNDHKNLAELIYQFRDKYGYNTSEEFIYEYAMNFLDESSGDEYVLRPASEEFINSKKNDYKFSKIMSETPDEIIRKLRLTMLISLRGAGRFIDINKFEIDKVKHVIKTYSENIEFQQDIDKYFEYMGIVDKELIFKAIEEETDIEIGAKEGALIEWSERDWNELRNEMLISTSARTSNDPVLKYIVKPARLEFLTAIVLKKALPNVIIKANYRADDQGLPFNVASGGRRGTIGADIDIYEQEVHAIAEPTASNARSFHVEHELPSIRNHVIESYKYDTKSNEIYTEWFALFIAARFSRDVGDQAALIKKVNDVNIYPWTIDDFVEFSKKVTSIKDYKIIRDYAKPQRIGS